MWCSPRRICSDCPCRRPRSRRGSRCDAPPNPSPRLAFPSRSVGKQCRHLLATDQRLCDQPFSATLARQLEASPGLVQRVEALVGRFGCLHDAVGDRLLTALLAALGETPGPAIDNLDRAERLGWVDFADT